MIASFLVISAQRPSEVPLNLPTVRQGWTKDGKPAYRQAGKRGMTYYMALNSVWTKIVSKALVCVFILAGVGGIVFIFTKDYFSSESRQFRRQMNLIKEREEAYKNDKFGGSTPEETLELFIGALKKGDTGLASKYFVIDKQEEWKSYLDGVKRDDGLSMIVKESGDLKLSKKEEEKAFFTIANSQNIVEVQVIVTKNQNGKWKITEL